MDAARHPRIQTSEIRQRRYQLAINLMLKVGWETAKADLNNNEGHDRYSKHFFAPLSYTRLRHSKATTLSREVFSKASLLFSTTNGRCKSMEGWAVKNVTSASHFENATSLLVLPENLSKPAACFSLPPREHSQLSESFESDRSQTRSGWAKKVFRMVFTPLIWSKCAKGF